MTRRNMTVTVRRLHDEEDELEAYAGFTPAERMAMMHALARDCWALFRAAQGGHQTPDADPGLSRRVVRVQRRAR